MIAWFLKKVKGWYCNRVQARIRDAASVVSFGILGGFLIQYIPSHSNPMGDPLFGIPSHPEWTLFI